MKAEWSSDDLEVLAERLHFWMKRVDLDLLTVPEYDMFRHDSDTVNKLLEYLHTLQELGENQERVDGGISGNTGSTSLTMVTTADNDSVEE